jgi:hypothetical protein
MTGWGSVTSDQPALQAPSCKFVKPWNNARSVCGLITHCVIKTNQYLTRKRLDMARWSVSKDEILMTLVRRVPGEYKTFARRCIELAAGAKDAKHQKTMLDMARRWSTLAVRLERARELADRPPRKRMKKYQRRNGARC